MTEPTPEPAPEPEVQVSKTVQIEELTYECIGTAMTNNDVPADAFINTTGGSGYAYPRSGTPNAAYPYQVTFTWFE